MNIDRMNMTDEVFKIMLDSKENKIEEACIKLSICEGEFRTILKEELNKSNMKSGACNLAVDFLIIAIDELESKGKDLRKIIKESILNSAIYYANIKGVDPTTGRG